MKPFKTSKEDNYVELYRSTMLTEMENTTVEDIPFFVNGIKVTQKGYEDTYLLIYQEILSNIVVIDVHDGDGTLVNKQRCVFDNEKNDWVNLPIKEFK